jgi:signal transduction histidine kinase
MPSMRDILVVDDIPANLVAMESALEPLGRRLVFASSGQEALMRLLEQDFALVLLDVQMPDMDGYETAKWIRTRERTKHLPIIFVTAHSHEDQAVLRAYRLGAVDFLFKPLHAEVLRAKTKVFCDLADAQVREREQVLAEQKAAHAAELLQMQVEAQRAANDALIASNEQLALADRRKNEFLAMLGHELRNPLAPIRTSLELIGQMADKPVPPRVLGILDRHLTHVIRLVDDLLDIARISNGKIELRKEPIALNDVVNDALAMARPQVEHRRHTLELALCPDRLVVDGDRARLVQVVSNILNNAARYTPEGGRIELYLATEGERACVRVADNGIGIAPELLGRVFEMFVQERVTSDGNGGLGLGLSLVSQLVALHNGSITAQSAGKGLGSTFELQLPLAR